MKETRVFILDGGTLVIDGFHIYWNRGAGGRGALPRLQRADRPRRRALPLRHRLRLRPRERRAALREAAAVGAADPRRRAGARGLPAGGRRLRRQLALPLRPLRREPPPARGLHGLPRAGIRPVQGARALRDAGLLRHELPRRPLPRAAKERGPRPAGGPRERHLDPARGAAERRSGDRERRAPDRDAGAHGGPLQPACRACRAPPDAVHRRCRLHPQGARAGDHPELPPRPGEGGRLDEAAQGRGAGNGTPRSSSATTARISPATPPRPPGTAERPGTARRSARIPPQWSDDDTNRARDSRSRLGAAGRRQLGHAADCAVHGPHHRRDRAVRRVRHRLHHLLGPTVPAHTPGHGRDPVRHARHVLSHGAGVHLQGHDLRSPTSHRLPCC